MNYQKIKQLIELKNITLRELCQEIDITEQGFHQMIRNKSMKVDVLEGIAKVLDVNASYFFSETLPEDGKKIIQAGNNNHIGIGNGNSNTNASKELETCRKEVEYLKKQVKDKEEIIELLKGKK